MPYINLQYIYIYLLLVYNIVVHYVWYMYSIDMNLHKHGRALVEALCHQIRGAYLGMQARGKTSGKTHGYKHGELSLIPWDTILLYLLCMLRNWPRLALPSLKEQQILQFAQRASYPLRYCDGSNFGDISNGDFDVSTASLKCPPPSLQPLQPMQAGKLRGPTPINPLVSQLNKGLFRIA
jgi:hypothetical protein